MPSTGLSASRPATLAYHRAKRATAKGERIRYMYIQDEARATIHGCLRGQARASRLFALLLWRLSLIFYQVIRDPRLRDSSHSRLEKQALERRTFRTSRTFLPRRRQCPHRLCLSHQIRRFLHATPHTAYSTLFSTSQHSRLRLACATPRPRSTVVLDAASPSRSPTTEQQQPPPRQRADRRPPRRSR